MATQWLKAKYINREDTLASLTCYDDEQWVWNQQSGNHQELGQLPPVRHECKYVNTSWNGKHDFSKAQLVGMSDHVWTDCIKVRTPIVSSRTIWSKWLFRDICGFWFQTKGGQILEIRHPLETNIWGCLTAGLKLFVTNGAQTWCIQSICWVLYTV